MITRNQGLLLAALAALIAGAATFLSGCAGGERGAIAPDARESGVRMASGGTREPSAEMLERAAMDPPGGRRRRARVPVEFRELHVEMEAGSVLRVRSFGAPVVVRGAERADVFVRAEIGATTRERLADVRVEVRREGAETIVEPEWPGERGRGEFSWFEIETPSAIGAVIVETDVGPVEFRGVSGRAEIAAGSGDVRVHDQGGPVRVRTARGGVEIVSPEGNVEVNAELATIRVIEAAGSVRATAVGGGVAVVFAPAARGPLHVTARDGEVDVTVGEGFEGEMELVSVGMEPVVFPGERYRPAVTPDWTPMPRVHRRRFGEVEVVFSEGGERSSVRVTGAGITLRRR